MTVAVPSSWNGVVEKSISAPLDKVWDVASDFLSFPNLLTIEPVEGENRVPGCTRKVTNIPGRTDTDSAQWAKQKLVEIDADKHVFSYEFLENNTGVEPGYYSTFQVHFNLQLLNPSINSPAHTFQCFLLATTCGCYSVRFSSFYPSHSHARKLALH